MAVGGHDLEREEFKAFEITTKKDYETFVQFPFGRKPIGKGSFGVVRKCSYRGNIAAEKEILLFANRQGKNSNEVVKKVVELWGKFKCENIVKLYAVYFDQEESKAKLIMEFVEPGSLRSLIKKYDKIGFPEKTLVRLMLDIANGVNYIHSRYTPIIHRDIKSDNILIERKGQRLIAKLSDFDFLREAHSNSEVMSSGGYLAFTAPELLGSARDTGLDETKCDIYSLSFVFWELADCSMLVPHNLDQHEFIMKCIKNWRPSEKPRYCSNEIWELIKLCWVPEPILRPTAMAIHSKIRSIEEKLNSVHYKSITTKNLHVAIIGSSGVGKSTLINTLRGLRPEDPDSARVGVTATTLVPTSYPHPEYDDLVLWDLPGVGTLQYPKDLYLSKVRYTKFHAFLIVFSGRFTENDLFLAESLRKSNREYFFVRSKVDIDIINDKEDYPSLKKSEIMGILRQDIADHLKNAGISARDEDIFLVNCKKDNELEFPKLVNSMTNKVTDRRALMRVNNSCNIL